MQGASAIIVGPLVLGLQVARPDVLARITTRRVGELTSRSWLVQVAKPKTLCSTNGLSYTTLCSGIRRIGEQAKGRKRIMKEVAGVVRWLFRTGALACSS